MFPFLSAGAGLGRGCAACPRMFSVFPLVAGSSAISIISGATAAFSPIKADFDDARSDLRPGYVSHVLAMVVSALGGAGRQDFLAGDNQLKRSSANEPYAMGSHRFGRPTAGLRFEAAAIRMARGALGRRCDA